MGDIIDACTCNFNPCDLFVAKAKAALQALCATKEKNYDKVIIEEDSVNVILALNNND